MKKLILVLILLLVSNPAQAGPKWIQFLVGSASIVGGIYGMSKSNVIVPGTTGAIDLPDGSHHHIVIEGDPNRRYFSEIIFLSGAGIAGIGGWMAYDSFKKDNTGSQNNLNVGITGFNFSRSW